MQRGADRDAYDDRRDRIKHDWRKVVRKHKRGTWWAKLLKHALRDDD